MTNNSLISVIIPVYNTEEYLERCLISILNNTYKNLEVILVDDGSTDNSGKICDDYALKDERITVIHKENGGQAIARNLALDKIKGDYIAFIDSDDFVHKNYFEFLLKGITENNADVSVCSFTREMPISDFENQTIPFDFSLVDKKKFFKEMYEEKWAVNIAPWGKIYKKSLFDNMRFPEGIPYEDAFLIYKVIFKGSTIVESDGMMYYYFVNNSSTTLKKDNSSKLVWREKALREHRQFYDNIKGYEEVAKSAKRFYLAQLFLMCWQLKEGFTLNDENYKMRKYIHKKLMKYLFKYRKVCTKEELINYYEECHNFSGGILRKFFG